MKTPVSLQWTVWWYITQHFGHCARDKDRQLQFGDLKIEKDFTSGCEYLVLLTERSTKMRNGERPLGSKWLFNRKAFATGSERCPVQFAFYCPTETCKDDSPLFLQIRYNIEYTSNKVSYFSKLLWKNSVVEFLSKARIILKNNSSGKILDHRTRKTTITNLLNQKINPLYLQQISGHKKLKSLNSYHTALIS